MARGNKQNTLVGLLIVVGFVIAIIYLALDYIVSLMTDNIPPTGLGYLLLFSVLGYGYVAYLITNGKLGSNSNNEQEKAHRNQALVDLKQQIDELQEKLKTKESDLATQTAEAERLSFKYKDLENAEEKLAFLKKEIPVLEDIKKDLDLVQVGFYSFKYDFGESVKYKEKMDELRQKEKALLKEYSPLVWDSGKEVFGLNLNENERMSQRIGKLALMAFNGEFDSIISTVKYNNVKMYIEKIEKVAKNIETLLKDYDVHFRIKFLDIKKEEIALTHEYQETLYKEKEEQRLIREQMKEEEKAQREAQKAQDDAEREAKSYEKALEKAREEMQKNQNQNNDEFLLKIQELEQKLLAANEQKERAKSQAELTRRGHVYVISNIGSFGENVYKIGMTRRLDPNDRVKELGDASVPFEFDVHAMIFSDDAPTLERKLHACFNDRRVNLINDKKEFFRVSLEEIEKACVANCESPLQMTKVAEAKEYNMSILKLKNG